MQEDSGPEHAGSPTPGSAPNGPEAGDIEHAEKLAAVEFTPRERSQMIEGIGRLVEGYRARRSVTLANDLSPAVLFRPASGIDAPTEGTPSTIERAPGTPKGARPPQPTARRGTNPPRYPAALPESDEDIAYAPVANLSEWIRTRRLSSTHLTEIYLERLERLGPPLECLVTLTPERALRAARRADEEIRTGRYRGPLHGIPWGAKDLFDTAGIPTTWGAEPFRNRVPELDAAVVRSLDAAGAVLIAKLSLGALAYGDIWFGGRTRNPWDPSQGSSGSSAGSAAATAAGLVAFSLGTETMGSIISPSLRCGVTGLRPTFGRVPRTGSMALCWSFDKIGPICRTVDDAFTVLSAIAGADAGDPDSVALPLVRPEPDAVRGLRVGYRPAWFEGEEANASDHALLSELRSLGARLVEIELPDLPYEQIMVLVYAEAAAAFEELTLDGSDDTLAWQEAEAWPNIFRTSRLIPAVEYIQMQRFRRLLMQLMSSLFGQVDLIVSPGQVEEMVLITNATGHPSLTLRSGFDEKGRPVGTNLFGRLYEEGTLAAFGAVLEERLALWQRRPGLGGVRDNPAI